MTTPNRCSRAARVRTCVGLLITIVGVSAFIFSAISPHDDDRQHEATRSGKVLRIGMKSAKSACAIYTASDINPIGAATCSQPCRSHTYYFLSTLKQIGHQKIIQRIVAARAPPAL